LLAELVFAQRQRPAVARAAVPAVPPRQRQRQAHRRGASARSYPAQCGKARTSRSSLMPLNITPAVPRAKNAGSARAEFQWSNSSACASGRLPAGENSPFLNAAPVVSVIFSGSPAG
jgi:hypothetical protein